jgi:uncharacterized repeat protein (TIGR01451 family)
MNDGDTVYYNPGPDFASGYGRVDAQAAVDAIQAQQVREGEISNGQTDAYTLTVPADTSMLQVTLAWDDVPGTPNALLALVNNLDLALVEPDGSTTHFPWVLDPASPTNHATRGVDNINNVEQIEVDYPTAGTWALRVSGTHVPQGSQLYSLVSSTSPGNGGGHVGPVEYADHAINDDAGNGDRIANPGETIELILTLGNRGSDPAHNVRSVLSTEDPYVTLLITDTGPFGDLAGGGTATHIAPLSFRISPAAPDEHALQFGLTISADNGGPWNDSFEMIVHESTPGDDIARVSIAKVVDPGTIYAGEWLTYTIWRSLTLSGTHTYSETLIDPIPEGTTYVANSATLNGVPVSAIYSPTLQSLHLVRSGVFTTNHELTLTFQVQVDNAANAVINTITGTASIDGIVLTAPCTATATATAGCAVPGAPILQAPLDGATGCTRTPFFHWSWVPEAEEYRIQVADDRAFDSPTIDQALARVFFVTPSPLPAGTYYWRVRSSNGCGVSLWSEPWHLIVLPVPSAPTLLSPADGAITRDAKPTLNWEAADGADTYSVQVDDDDQFGSPSVDAKVSEAAYTPTVELETGTYYWRVQAAGPCGTGPWASAWMVTVDRSEDTFLYLPIVLHGTP